MYNTYEEATQVKIDQAIEGIECDLQLGKSLDKALDDWEAETGFGPQLKAIVFSEFI